MAQERRAAVALALGYAAMGGLVLWMALEERAAGGSAAGTAAAVLGGALMLAGLALALRRDEAWLVAMSGVPLALLLAIYLLPYDAWRGSALGLLALLAGGHLVREAPAFGRGG